MGRLPLGEGRYKYFYGTDERGVTLRMDRARIDLERGIQPTVGRDTFARYLPEWLEGIRVSVGETSWLRYESICRVHLIPKFGRRRLVDLDAPQVLAFYAQKQKEGLEAATIRQIHNVLRQALEAAKRYHLVQQNVCRDIKPPRLPEREMHTLDARQRQQFLERASQTSYGALYALALATGMRRGELLGLRWSDVDLEHGFLQVRRQRRRVRDLEHDTYRKELRELKTKRSRREIDLGANIVAILRDHKTEQGKARLQLGPSWQGAAKHDDDLCFANDLGGLGNAESLQCHCKRLFRQLGFQKELHFHSLRHTHATMLLEQGIQPHAVAQRLGDTVATVLTTYAHVTKRMKQEAAKATDALLWPEAR